MSLTIDMADRISNRTPVTDPSDKTALNTDHVLTILDKIVNGNYRARLKPGTTANRPVSPEIFEVRGNADFSGIELYTTHGWLVIYGIWTTATRPSASGLAVGSNGWNISIGAKEYWNGNKWRMG